ncbi:MAG: GNAT family N-acetyltransferase [Bauldia sp.]
MTGTEIRDAVEADLAGLNRLEVNSFSADRLSRRSLRRLIGSPSAGLRVAGAADATLGYHLTLFRRGGAVARLYSIAVAEGERGSGLARALMADAERLAARRGSRAVRLEVRCDNQPAIRLYERLGYRRIGVHKRYYADGTDALRFEKTLSAGEEGHAADGDEDRSPRRRHLPRLSPTARVSTLAPTAGVLAAES